MSPPSNNGRGMINPRPLPEDEISLGPQAVEREWGGEYSGDGTVVSRSLLNLPSKYYWDQTGGQTNPPQNEIWLPTLGTVEIGYEDGLSS